MDFNIKQSIQPLIQAALGDTLFAAATPTEDDLSRESSPAKEMPLEVIPADEVILRVSLSVFENSS